MAKNKMQDLRDHLFETLEALKDEDKPMDVARAEAIANVAQVLVNAAKVTVQYLNTIGQLEGDEMNDFFKAERALSGGDENEGKKLSA